MTTSRVMVIRAWREDDHVRVRIIVDGDRTNPVVIDGAAPAAMLVQRLLLDLEQGGASG